MKKHYYIAYNEFTEHVFASLKPLPYVRSYFMALGVFVIELSTYFKR